MRVSFASAVQTRLWTGLPWSDFMKIKCFLWVNPPREGQWCFVFPIWPLIFVLYEFDPHCERSASAIVQIYELHPPDNIYIYIYIYAFSRRFYPKRLTLHSSYSFNFFFFYQLLLSLGIEPMILVLLAPCSTIWATGKITQLQTCKRCLYSLLG